MVKMKPRWHPKVTRERIWQLYQSEVKGIADESLIDDVGIVLLLRCKSILLTSSRRVMCPVCNTEFELTGGKERDNKEAFSCPNPDCDWEITWEKYHGSWRHRELFGGKAIAIFQKYLKEYPKAKTAPRKMVLIDELIHSFHWDLKVNLPNRSVANNLIEGNHAQVLELLDRISYGDIEKKGKWKDTVDTMMKRRRGQLS